MIKNILVLFFVSVCVMAAELKIMTEDLLPAQYQKEGRLKGHAVEIVRAIKKKTGNTDPIEMTAWNRAYELTLRKKNHLLFSMARLAKRETLFQWVGPISVGKTFLYHHKNKPLRLNDFKDVNARKLTIGVAKNSASFHKLKDFGIDDSLFVTSYDAYGNYRAFAHERIDLIPVGAVSFPFIARKAGVEPSVFVNSGLQIHQSDFYIAFSKSTDPAIVAKWQHALDELKEQGVIDKIYEDALQNTYRDFGITLK